ncbi:hypothetical protein R4Z10_16620 [Niallia sp. XMNu-256]|uniref:hypothetical protein n=1 Tax=Niallia sp. XMNu-256 TaxID=3082444 RepID=UPI0030CA8CFA
MQISKYVKSQSGAALILVLFAVLFLSITGAVLLNTTTYSLESIEKNKEIQKEFYLAEGALEIEINSLIDEMNKYKNSDGEEGPYFFLLREFTQTPEYIEENYIEKQYKIAETSVLIKETINGKLYDPLELEFNPEKVVPISLTLEASYLDTKASNIKRIAEIKVNAISQITTVPITTTPPSTAGKALNFNIKSNKMKEETIIKIPDEKRNQISASDFFAVVEEIQQKPSSIVTLNVENLKVNGNRSLHVPKGQIYYIKNLTFNGTPNLLVEGVLVVENFSFNGNSNMEIDTGIIVKNLDGNASAAITIKGEANGIPCSLISTICNESEINNPSDPDDSITIERVEILSNVDRNLNLSTKRQ